MKKRILLYPVAFTGSGKASTGSATRLRQVVDELDEPLMGRPGRFIKLDKTFQVKIGVDNKIVYSVKTLFIFTMDSTYINLLEQKQFINKKR